MTETHPDFGELYRYSDHKRGDHIDYRNADGQEQCGEIVWVATGGTLPSGRTMPPHYVVYPDCGGMTDCVLFSDVIMNEARNPNRRPS